MQEKTRSPLDGIKFNTITDIGMCRSENQDSFGIISNNNFKFLFVADGMGGVKGGAQASSLVVSVLKEKLSDLESINSKSIVDVVKESNRAVYREGKSKKLDGMGTTLSGLCFTKEKVYSVNVGDSRVYRIRDNKIVQLTEDHTVISELLKSGAIDKEKIANNPVSHMLTRSLGPSDKVEVDCKRLSDKPMKDDFYLICSDGLYNLVEDSDINKLISDDLKSSNRNLVKLANDRGGNDNITIILVKLTQEIYSHEVYFHEKMTETLEFDLSETEKLLEEETTIEIPSNHFLKQYKSKTKYTFISFSAVIATFLLFNIFTNYKNSEAGYVYGKKSIEDKKETVAEDYNKIFVEQFNSGLTQEEVDSIANRIVELKERLADYNSLLNLFNKFNKKQAESVISHYNEVISLSKKKLKAVNAEMEKTTSKLAVWVGRRERIKSTPEVNLAAELAVVSDVIAKNQIEFQKATREYLKSIEELRYDPNSVVKKENLSMAAEGRKKTLKTLSKAVKNEIKDQMKDISNLIAKLSTKKSELNKKVKYIQSDLKIINDSVINQITSGDADLLDQKKAELNKLISAMQLELKELNELVDNKSK